MNGKNTEYITLFKAFADPNRLMIIDMLSGRELCACKILEKLIIGQSTLSHHMKILCECGLVNNRKDGKWLYYSLNNERIHEAIDYLFGITTSKKDCILREEKCNCE